MRGIISSKKKKKKKKKRQSIFSTQYAVRRPRLANGAAKLRTRPNLSSPPPWRALLGRPDPLGSRLLGYGCCFGSARLHNPENRCFRGILFWFYSSDFSDAVIIHHCKTPPQILIEGRSIRPATRLDRGRSLVHGLWTPQDHRTIKRAQSPIDRGNLPHYRGRMSSGTEEAPGFYPSVFLLAALPPQARHIRWWAVPGTGKRF